MVTTIPTDPSLIDSLAFARLWPEGMNLESDSVEVRRRILHIAETVLRRKTSQETFALWIEGMTTAAIANAQSRSPEAVHRTLWGVPSRGLAGAVAQVGEALRNDEVFTAMVKKEAPADPIGRHAIATWCAGAPPDRFVEMAALLIFKALADADGNLTVSDAYGAMHPSIVTHALPRLRWGGWIATNGITIRVLKIPGSNNA